MVGVISKRQIPRSKIELPRVVRCRLDANGDAAQLQEGSAERILYEELGSVSHQRHGKRCSPAELAQWVAWIAPSRLGTVE